jgi:hypothetical protein
MAGAFALRGELKQSSDTNESAWAENKRTERKPDTKKTRRRPNQQHRKTKALLGRKRSEAHRRWDKSTPATARIPEMATEPAGKPGKLWGWVWYLL